MRITQLLLCPLIAASLAACGGGDGPEPSPPADANGVPATATASVGAFVAFAAGLAEDEFREPFSVEGVVPPSSETAEPAPVPRNGL